MLNLNLLPPEEKRNLAYAIRTRAVIALCGGLVSVFVIFMVLLLPTFFLLVLQKSDVLRAVMIERESQERAGIAAQAAELIGINQLAERVVRHEKDQLKIFPLFEAVAREVPPTVHLKTLKLRSGPRELAVEGFAPTREDLLQFLRALERHPAVEKVSSPLSNLIKETDITFSVVAKLK